MKWRIIDKKSAILPKSGSYGDWKPQLAQEAQYQCVYCCIHESNFGGFRNFHVEHYRPKSKFPTLENAYNNLFYSCAICNAFKGNDWPVDMADGDFSQAGYPDPSQVDYSWILKVDYFSGFVTSDIISGKYVIERLYLNRPHLIGLRALTDLIRRFEEMIAEFSVLMEKGVPDSEVRSVIGVLQQIAILMIKLNKARPYAVDQIRKQG